MIIFSSKKNALRLNVLFIFVYGWNNLSSSYFCFYYYFYLEISVQYKEAKEKKNRIAKRFWNCLICSYGLIQNYFYINRFEFSNLQSGLYAVNYDSPSLQLTYKCTVFYLFHAVVTLDKQFNYLLYLKARYIIGRVSSVNKRLNWFF